MSFPDLTTLAVCTSLLVSCVALFAAIRCRRELVWTEEYFADEILRIRNELENRRKTKTHNTARTLKPLRIFRADSD